MLMGVAADEVRYLLAQEGPPAEILDLRNPDPRALDPCPLRLRRLATGFPGLFSSFGSLRAEYCYCQPRMPLPDHLTKQPASAWPLPSSSGSQQRGPRSSCCDFSVRPHQHCWDPLQQPSRPGLSAGFLG